MPALFREGPDFGSELSVSWLIWSHVLHQQENHLLVTIWGERPVLREYLKIPERVRNQILSEAEKYYLYRHHSQRVHVGLICRPSGPDSFQIRWVC